MTVVCYVSRPLFKRNLLASALDAVRVVDRVPQPEPHLSFGAIPILRPPLDFETLDTPRPHGWQLLVLRVSYCCLGAFGPIFRGLPEVKGLAHAVFDCAWRLGGRVFRSDARAGDVVGNGRNGIFGPVGFVHSA